VSDLAALPAVGNHIRKKKEDETMFKLLLAAVGGAATAASLSEETQGKLKAAARGVRDDLGAATKDARAAASREWGRVKRFVREEILEEPPRPSRSDPPAQA